VGENHFTPKTRCTRIYALSGCRDQSALYPIHASGIGTQASSRHRVAATTLEWYHVLAGEASVELGSSPGSIDGSCTRQKPRLRNCMSCPP
jgi:hypothetical protein